MRRYTPLPGVLNRPNLLLGAEREPMLLLCSGCVGIAFMSGNWITTIICATVWFIIAPLLRRLARRDPQWIGVYVRSLFYQWSYSARSRPAASEGADLRMSARVAGWSILALIAIWWVF